MAFSFVNIFNCFGVSGRIARRCGSRVVTMMALGVAGAASVGGAMSCVDNVTPQPERPQYRPGELEPLSCVPNLDRRIDASELREALGVSVTLLVNPAGTMAPVDLAGAVNVNGDRRWDFSAGAELDEVARLEAQALEGKWYAARFPAGQFVVANDLGGRVENIYRRDEQGFYLLGVASREEQPQEGQTLLVYEQPVELYRFPLELGSKWVSVGTSRDGRLQGLPYAGRDTYEVEVEAIGELKLPDLILDQVHMVRTRVTLEPAVGQSVSQQQVSFLFECFGEVARATSALNETEKFFKSAAELRRLGLDPDSSFATQ